MTDKLRKVRIDQFKSEIKSELDLIEKPKEKINHCLKQISVLAKEDSTLLQARRFIYIVFCLTLHERNGGLRDSQMENLFEIANALCQVLGIKPIRSQLAFLYGELHLVRSQILLKKGNVWGALWQQQMSKHLSGKHAPGGEGFQYLALALRTMRLGHSHEALGYFELAEKSKISRAAFERARIGRLRCLRLSNRFDEFSYLLESTEVDEAGSGLDLEVQWEQACYEAFQTNSIAAIMKLLKKSKPHYIGTYVFEGYLWSRAVQSERWMPHFSKIESLYRNPNFNISANSQLYRTCQALEYAYEPGMTMALKLDKLGQIMESVEKFHNIDKILLSLLAVARCLVRINGYFLARALLNEYRSLSIKLSQGSSHDVLNLAGDLFQSKWLEKMGTNR
ncbi:hypothetical protein [Pseudobacteriovorax antillogorgiicola]|uniref:Uncharacterized protein n=1 Tax=Pseudobacteriovorax antillogorgiicola TaxID=1513793 RepID=A0A1Y6CU92_9BACT|nr:hypothetical protein [Pseudobacteriovorax antillogorgiicola]TCS44623.1 hypothetical protein EDD56_13256 [Pseudobacteriovorax antillogorgiicola]SMF78388.1 hypothetical protein SAMN06296036_13256 [Pseudobacteriovorax antillogorgiicola]